MRMHCVRLDGMLLTCIYNTVGIAVITRVIKRTSWQRLYMCHYLAKALYSELSGLLQVQAGKPKARRALKSEDSLSVSATDSEADSMLTDSGAAKRKPGAKKGGCDPPRDTSLKWLPESPLCRKV